MNVPAAGLDASGKTSTMYRMKLGEVAELPQNIYGKKLLSVCVCNVLLL